MIAIEICGIAGSGNHGASIVLAMASRWRDAKWLAHGPVVDGRRNDGARHEQQRALQQRNDEW